MSRFTNTSLGDLNVKQPGYVFDYPPQGLHSMKSFLILLAAGVCIALAGCSYPDYQRPVLRNYAADLLPSPPRPATEEQSGAERTRKLAEALTRWQKAAGKEKPEEYVVGPGDVLSVPVSVPAQVGVRSAAEMPVSEDGNLSLPLIGTVHVAGLSIKEIEAKVATLYADGYYRDPTVTVVVTNYVSKRVLVTGAVASPRVVMLRTNRMCLLEAILQAGGVTDKASQTVRLTRPVPSGESNEARAPAEDLSLSELVAGGEVQRQAWVYPEDMVYVVPLPTQLFFVQGYVRAPGPYPLPADGTPLGMMDAIAFARGLDVDGLAEKAVLLRNAPQGKEVYRVDLTRVAAGDEPDVIIKPGDTIIVGTSWGHRVVSGILHAIGLRSLAPPTY